MNEIIMASISEIIFYIFISVLIIAPFLIAFKVLGELIDININLKKVLEALEKLDKITKTIKINMEKEDD